MVAQQVQDGLHRLAHAHDAGRHGIAREVAPAKASQQGGLAVQRQAIAILGGDDPGQQAFAEQALGDDLSGLGRQAQCAIATGAGVFDPLVANHAHLLGNDVELLAGLDADFPQRRAIVRTHAFGLGQLMAHHVPRQCRVQRFAPTPGALVCRSVNAIIVGVLVFLSGSLGLCAQDLEEHVLLTLGADLAPGGKYLAHELVEPLLEQVTLGAHEDQLTSERFAAPIGGFQRLLQGCNIFGGRRQTHCRIRLTLPSESSQKKQVETTHFQAAR